MFEEIKKKYPKAWRVFIEWCFDIDLYDRWDNDGEITLTEEFEFINLIGWLFKFFDERGIIIITETFNNETWYYDIYDYGEINPWVAGDLKFKTRQEAWMAAFKKGFELLEEVK